MRAEQWLDEIRRGINPSISFGCDCCATNRRAGGVDDRLARSVRLDHLIKRLL
jgi:hypothetical protein